MRHLNYILTTAFILLTSVAFAVKAIPEKVTHLQPDGTVLTLSIHGDEFLHWLETTDGFVIHPGDDGGLYYAVSDINGNLVPGNILAHTPEQRDQNEQSYINTLDKDLKFSKSQLAAAKEARAARMKSDKAGAFPTTGINNLLMILVNFSDTSPTYTQTNFNNYMNQPGYNGIGSFKEYYYENSYGQLTMNTTVTAWVTVSNTHNYYGQNDSQGYDMYPQQLVYEAINLVDPVVNFSNFDNNSDGEVDGIAIIHQGTGEEASSNAYDIWSHSWSIAGAYTPAQCTKDGVLVYDYTIQPEVLSSVIYTGISTIGVMCHEFGHNLGAPDYYDTDYATNGQFDGTGDWDLMGGGSWNYNSPNPPGSQPAHHNIYTKVFYGWISANEIFGPSTFSLAPTETTAKAYFYRTGTNNEYFMLENRVPSTSVFDAALPGQGMLIYHVDGDWINQHWNSNDINNGAHQGLYPKDAGGSGINTSGCPFPGTTFNTYFTDTSTPNSKSWANANTNNPITDITPSGNNINFNIGTPPPNGVTADTTGAFPGVMVAWAPPAGGQVLNSQWLYYDTGSSYQAYGYGPGIYRYAIGFLPAQLSGYLQIDEFSLLTGSGNPPTSPAYFLDITQGTPDNPSLFSMAVPYTVNFTWSTLTIPGIPFDDTQMLYFVITTFVNPSEFPMVIDNSPAVDGLGNLMNLGGGWTTWLAANAMQGNWCMRAKVSVPGTTAKESASKVLSPTNNPALRDGFKLMADLLTPISGDKGLKPSHEADNNDSKNITGYQVIRNSTPPLALGIVPSGQQYLLDAVPIPGSYTYSVYALYNEGTSSASNSSALNYPAALTLNVNPPATGNAVGSGLHPFNSTVTASATPATGYEFVDWFYNGSQISTSNPYSFTIVQDMMLTANFQKTSHQISLSASPTAGGTVTGAGTYLYGTTASCVATPNTGYNFDDWTESSTQVSTNQTYSFTVTTDRSLQANFSLKTYTINTSSSPTAGGTTSGGGDYTHGSTVNLSASANSGYDFVNWTEGASVISTNSSLSFTATSDRDLVANFTVTCSDNLHLNNITITGSVPDYEAKYNIYAAENSATFVVQSPNGNVTFAAGGSITLYPGFHAQSGSGFRAYIGGSCAAKEDPLISYQEPECLSDCGNYRIFPNPSSSGIFTLEALRSDQNRKIVAIYDFSGRRISFTEFSMLTHTTINLSAQEKGIYLVRIISKDNSETLKIIRQ